MALLRTTIKIGLDIDGVIAKTDVIFKKMGINEYIFNEDFWKVYYKIWKNYHKIPVRKEYIPLLSYKNVYVASNRPVDLIPYTYAFFKHHNIQINNLIILPLDVPKTEFFDLIVDDNPDLRKILYSKLWFMPLRPYNKHASEFATFAGTDHQIIKMVKNIVSP